MDGETSPARASPPVAHAPTRGNAGGCPGERLARFLLGLGEHEAHPALLGQRERLARRARELPPGSPEYARLLEGIRFLCYVRPPAP